MAKLTNLQVLSMNKSLQELLADVKTMSDYRFFKAMVDIETIKLNMLYVEPMPRPRVEFVEEPEEYDS